MMQATLTWITFSWALVGFVASSAATEPFAVDLAASGAESRWALADRTAILQNGELVLDGRQRMARAFYLPDEFADFTISAKFLVEPQPDGVLACGFMFRAVDGANFYYVHFDRGQAILVRHSPNQAWSEIKRVSGLAKPPGQWHEGKVECVGPKLKVSLNGTVLYEADDSTLSRGRIGFYGSQGLVHVKDISITGERLEPSQPLVIPKPNFVYVCEDAGAGGYEAFPDVCRLRDGRLMCVFYAGYGHVALPNERLPRGGRISYCTSADEGRSWSPAETLYDGPDDDRDPSLVQLKNGKLICNFFSLRKGDEPGKPYVGLGSWMVTSDDLGKTWSAPRQISKDYYCSSPIRELSSGRLVLGLYAEGAQSSHGAVVASENGGETWEKEVDIDNGGVRLDAETDLIELKDGTLYAAQRPQMSFATSKDQGRTWTVSRSMGFAGHCPYFLRTADDIILLAHRLPNTSLHYSSDECATWSNNVAVDEVIGAYPSLVNLKDGSVLIVYYEEGDGSSIRAKRFRATREGIQWLNLN